MLSKIFFTFIRKPIAEFHEAVSSDQRTQRTVSHQDERQVVSRVIGIGDRSGNRSRVQSEAGRRKSNPRQDDLDAKSHVLRAITHVRG